MTGTWKAGIAVVVGVTVAAGFVLLRGPRDSGDGQPASPNSEGMSPRPKAEESPFAPDPLPAASSPGQRQATGGTAGAGIGPDAAEATIHHLPLPHQKPSASDAARRKALADPRNPERWVEYAKALDSEGKPDLAVAALRRALHLGADFEGRREVMRLVREYEAYLGRTDTETPEDRRARDASPKPHTPAPTRAR